ncbi:MAG: hypothetical protein SVV80_06355 [Planctomycetota bacterium]|nr:hypothetical protein [Planctomycetota bacterium]
MQERYPDPIFNLVSVLGRSLAFCGARGCFRACLAHLEERGLLDREFAHAYHALTEQQGRSKSVSGARKSPGGKVVNIE